MSEIKTPLRKLIEGEVYVADQDGAHVIEQDHTHADILRFVVADIGKGDALHILNGIDDVA